MEKKNGAITLACGKTYHLSGFSKSTVYYEARFKKSPRFLKSLNGHIDVFRGIEGVLKMSMLFQKDKIDVNPIFSFRIL
jgi:hypothetical protein